MKVKDPSKKKTTKKVSLHPFEIVWYSLTGAVGVWGLTYIVLGLVANNLPIESEDKGLVKANSDFANIFGLDFFGWGLIILAIAAVAAVIVLLVYANNVDKKYEKETRRAARLAQLEAEEEKEEILATDALKQPVVEEKPVEALAVEEKPAEEPNQNSEPKAE